MITLYDNKLSGNGYKARLILELTRTPYQHIELSFDDKGTQGKVFKDINPLGKIPCVVFEDGRILTESNAILGYFAEGTDYLPKDPFLKAKVYEWLFFEQYSHEPYIAVVGHWLHDGNLTDLQKAQLPEKTERGHRALRHMNEALNGQDWLVKPTPTIADLALFAYTHMADEGVFSLKDYPHIRAWLGRVQNLQGFIPIT